MIELIGAPVVLHNGSLLDPAEAQGRNIDIAAARRETLAYRILAAHNRHADTTQLRLRFDALASHDITYVGIIQTARAGGLTSFPMPYVLTNCHNSLCAVGGTINEDDHLFGLSAAQKYGGIFVPPHLAVIHQYVREMMTKCGGMILGSDSHTRYGALGVMGIGEGGPELVKQLLNKTYDLALPAVVGVWLEGAPGPCVGPQDVALALVGAVFKNAFVKNKVLEFMGPGIAGLSAEYRCGIDVMTTETACLSSIWPTDETIRDWLALHGRVRDFTPLTQTQPACYDGMIRINLGRIEPMIALPFHPSNVWTVAEVNRAPRDILQHVEEEAKKQFGVDGPRPRLADKIRNGRLWADQGIIAGCAGGSFENLTLAAAILDGKSTGNGAFSLSLYPASAPQALALVRGTSAAGLMAAGAVIKNAFCGPCFGAGDTPANGALSIRHATRNFPNREGSRPAGGQIAAVALMDARSIAATAANGGCLTSAAELDWDELAQHADLTYHFDPLIYARRIYNGFNAAQPEKPLIFGPNIADWPTMPALPDHLLLRLASVITDPVTTTDELIPSGETSSLRSNPIKLAEFTLSRKDPGYVGRARAIQQLENIRQTTPDDPELLARVRAVCALCGMEKFFVPDNSLTRTGLGSAIFAVRPGDGSAREQAASSQKVLGGWANLATEYATKRYRSNLINWGMLPFIVAPEWTDRLRAGDYLLIPDIRSAVEQKKSDIAACLVRQNNDGTKARTTQISLMLNDLTEDDRRIILSGCLINFYNRHGS
ncbi:hydratase [Candidatus Desulfovibrio trichonymphae]|uniref:Aconitate hydratase A n=1 Tax=Candidatus Desulfovibrio trichonymphae TaxID=1725232 RepID=A0A1J1DUY5_9BACT|nr:hydratase [Candidatus Desulfovibrio trichonymphae]BAV91604.1 aconitate hydratase A [Candidatus Desulfovibrio trichonymphae]GHU98635.1 hydratase [Deltaproteobacteria bacterium]